jgi:hypothetical protein
MSEVQHLVEHRVGKAFNLRYTVADFTDDADVLPGGRDSRAFDFRFQLQ